MSGYEVVMEAIEKAAGAAGRAAEGVKPVDLAGTLAGVAQGLPGGTAIEAARLLGDVWGRELPTWARNMGDYSTQLSTAAHRYRTDEDAAEADLRAVARSGGSRPV
jgi:hypothetical protein